MLVRRRSQAALEVVAVMSFMLLILLPLIYLIYNYTNILGETMESSQISMIGNNIVSAAESIYYFGFPSRITIEETFPDGIVNITIMDEFELTFFMDNGNEIAFRSDVTLNGKFDSGSFTGGRKTIHIEARGEQDDVLLTIT